MPKTPNRCTCGKYPNLGIRAKRDGPRYEWSCSCGSNAFSYTEEGALDLWNDIMKKRPIVSEITRGVLSPAPDKSPLWKVWVENPDGALAIVDHQELEDALFFADQCEKALIREADGAATIFQHETALNLVRGQAEIPDLWMGDDIQKVRAALRQLHMAVEGGLANPLIDLLKGKAQ